MFVILVGPDFQAYFFLAPEDDRLTPAGDLPARVRAHQFDVVVFDTMRSFERERTIHILSLAVLTVVVGVVRARCRVVLVDYVHHGIGYHMPDRAFTQGTAKGLEERGTAFEVQAHRLPLDVGCEQRHRLLEFALGDMVVVPAQNLLAVPLDCALLVPVRGPLS